MGTDLKESESISVFYILEMLLKDVSNIMDPLTIEAVFPQVKTSESNGDES
jgi:hypothetical protein